MYIHPDRGKIIVTLDTVRTIIKRNFQIVIHYAKAENSICFFFNLLMIPSIVSIIFLYFPRTYQRFLILEIRRKVMKKRHLTYGVREFCFALSGR